MAVKVKLTAYTALAYSWYKNLISTIPRNSSYVILYQIVTKFLHDQLATKLHFHCFIVARMALS